MKKPGDGKGEYHACEQEIEEAVTLPKASWFHLRSSYGIACFTRLFYSLRLGCSDHIACGGATDLTGPGKTKLDHMEFGKVLEKNIVNRILNN